MTPNQLSALLVELLSLPTETEWVERKHNNDNPNKIAERISAVANSAALHGRNFGYLVWGVEDGTKNVVGTTFRPRQSKKGNEELENWLMRSQHPPVSFRIHEWLHQTVPIVLFVIPRASQALVRFGSEEFIRIGSLTKKLKEYTDRERYGQSCPTSRSRQALPSRTLTGRTFYSCSTSTAASNCCKSPCRPTSQAS